MIEIETVIKNSSFDWVKYSDYEYRADGNGEEYICPTAESQAGIINPAQMQVDLVIDSLNIGRFASEENANMAKVKSMILSFCSKYGLLGLMVSFPLSLDFLENEDVFFGKDIFTEKGTMPSNEYIKLFTPFQKAATGAGDTQVSTEVLPFTMFMEKPQVYNFVFAKSYAEKLSWVLRQFKELYHHFVACFYFDKTEDAALKVEYTARVNTFKLYNLGFQIKMTDKPTVVWDFVSLKILIDTVYSFMVSNDATPLRICKHCGAVFTASHIKMEFCAPQCRNQYNVYKCRGK